MAYVAVIRDYVEGRTSEDQYFEAFRDLWDEQDDEVGHEEFSVIVDRLWIDLDAYDPDVLPEHEDPGDELSGVTMKKWATAALRDLRRIIAETE